MRQRPEIGFLSAKVRALRSRALSVRVEIPQCRPLRIQHADANARVQGNPLRVALDSLREEGDAAERL